MEMRKVTVREGDVASISCPFCQKTKKHLWVIIRKQVNGS